jgi:hypothetical protein
MDDNKVKKKKRAKINSLVTQRLAANPELDEARARHQVMREVREAQKAKRARGRQEAAAIEERVRQQMEGQEPAAIRLVFAHVRVHC